MRRLFRLILAEVVNLKGRSNTFENSSGSPAISIFNYFAIWAIFITFVLVAAKLSPFSISSALNSLLVVSPISILVLLLYSYSNHDSVSVFFKGDDAWVDGSPGVRWASPIYKRVSVPIQNLELNINENIVLTDGRSISVRGTILFRVGDPIRLARCQKNIDPGSLMGVVRSSIHQVSNKISLVSCLSQESLDRCFGLITFETSCNINSALLETGIISDDIVLQEVIYNASK